MKLYWKYERLLKGYGGSSGSEARRCEHPQDKEAPGKKGFQIFLPWGMLKGRSTWASSQTHSGDVHRFVQSPSTSRTSKLSTKNSPRSLRHLPMTPQAVREKSKELKIERCHCYGNTYVLFHQLICLDCFGFWFKCSHLPGIFCTVPPATQLKLRMEPPRHQIQMRKEKKDKNNIQ